jgi:hypothetical protein
LRADGLALLSRLREVPLEDRVQDLEFGAAGLREWLERCNRDISMYRAECLLDFDTASQPQASLHTWEVNTKVTAAIDLWEERIGQINRVVALVDSLIRTTK